MLAIEKWLELVNFVTKEVSMKFGTKIGSAGPAPLLLAEDRSRIEAERLKEEAEQTDADQRAVANTQAIPSTNPPPKAMPSTEQVNLYLGAMDKEATARAKHAEAVTGDMPVVVVPLVVITPPEPPQWVKGNPRVAMPAVTEQQVRSSEKQPRIVIATIVILILFAIGLASVYRLRHPTPRAPIALTSPVTATTSAELSSAAVPNQEPTPHGLLPPLEPMWVEPGLQGVRGTRVRMSAQAAFPVRCATALTANWTSDVRFLCGVGQRRGNNLCGCVVTGLVP